MTADVVNDYSRAPSPSGWDTARVGAFIAVLAVVFLFPNLGSGDRSRLGLAQGASEGNAIVQSIWLSLAFILLWSIQDRWGAVKSQFTASLTLILGWCLLSTSWAILPSASFRQFVFMFVVVLTLAISVSSPRQPDTLVRILIAIVFAELIVKYGNMLLNPGATQDLSDLAESNLAGLWRAQYAHKNSAGSATALMIMLTLALRKQIGLQWSMILLAVNAYFLYRTGSKTAIYLVLPVYFFAYCLTKTRSLISCLLLVGSSVIAINAVTVGSIFLPNLKWIASKIIGDASFTGRTEVWSLLVYYASLFPFTGAGYQSFWNAGGDSPALRYIGTWTDGAFYGHQGYLDTLAALGFPGLILLLMFVVIRPVNDLSQIKDRGNPLLLALVCVWVYAILSSGTESSLLAKADHVWVACLIGIFGLRAMRLWEANPGFHGHKSASAMQS